MSYHNTYINLITCKIHYVLFTYMVIDKYVQGNENYKIMNNNYLLLKRLEGIELWVLGASTVLYFQKHKMKFKIK